MKPPSRVISSAQDRQGVTSIVSFLHEWAATAAFGRGAAEGHYPKVVELGWEDERVWTSSPLDHYSRKLVRNLEVIKVGSVGCGWWWGLRL